MDRKNLRVKVIAKVQKNIQIFPEVDCHVERSLYQSNIRQRYDYRKALRKIYPIFWEIFANSARKFSHQSQNANKQ